MRTGVRVLGIGGTVVAAALLVGGSSAGAATSGDDGAPRQVTLTFDVVTSPFSYTDLGAPGPSAADIIVFHDRLLSNGKDVGHEVGSCVVVEASGLANCTGVVTLDDRGTITYAFENAPPPKKVLAITGGSGKYRTAHGDGRFVESGHGTGTLTLALILG